VLKRAFTKGLGKKIGEIFIFCLEICKNRLYICNSSFYLTYQERQREIGPMKPWQPIQFTQLYEGAKSDRAKAWEDKSALYIRINRQVSPVIGHNHSLSC
jgi:hypothetical protein